MGNCRECMYWKEFDLSLINDKLTDKKYICDITKEETTMFHSCERFMETPNYRRMR